MLGESARLIQGIGAGKSLAHAPQLKNGKFRHVRTSSFGP
jgi:hypothetical protein